MKALVKTFEGRELRTVPFRGGAAIVACDIAKAIGYSRTSDFVELARDKYRAQVKVPTRGGPQKMTVLTAVGLQQALARSRKPKSADFARAFGIDVYRTKVTTIEAEVTSRVRSVFEGHKIETQKQFGPYRADIWLPQFGLIIEVDEDGHRRYNDIKEAARQGFLESDKQTVIRYTPEEQPIERLFGKIHNHIVDQLS